MSTDTGQGSNQPPFIQSGLCYAIFAYDAARSINLTEADRRIHETTERPSIAHKRRTPSYFEYQPAPLRVSQDAGSLSVGKFTTRPSVDLMIYDFGAVAVIYALPIEGPFEDLPALSEELYDNEMLLAESRLRVDQIVKVMGNAANQTHASPVVEDYVIFHVESFAQPLDPNSLWAIYARQIAQILRAERQALSGQEIEDALAMRVSYSTDDVTIVDWNAALLVDREGDDIRAVLEFANVELLEMRYVDQKLDRALDRPMKRYRASRGAHRGYSSRMAPTCAAWPNCKSTTLLYSKASITLKLLGDQFLARLYRMVNRRFHLGEWDESILRKLQTLESIYEKISDQVSTRRMEVLEWVIIFLIAFSIALEFIH